MFVLMSLEYARLIWIGVLFAGAKQEEPTRPSERHTSHFWENNQVCAEFSIGFKKLSHEDLRLTSLAAFLQSS